MELIKNLPDHKEELLRAQKLLNKVVKDMKWHDEIKVAVPSSKLTSMVYIVDTVLGVVGDLSDTRFEIRDQLEEHYSKHYIKSPELGKKIFLEEYHDLHKPYDRVKNKCFELLMTLDENGSIVETFN